MDALRALVSSAWCRRRPAHTTHLANRTLSAHMVLGPAVALTAYGTL